MKKIISFIIIFLLLSDAFAQIHSNKQKLDSLANHYMKNLLHYKGRKPIYNVQMSVQFKDKYKFHGAVGIIQKKGTILPDNYKFKIASVTKTFTSTIILQLLEEDKLNLSDHISKYLDKDIIDNLLFINGESYGNEITIQQLLNHTSGLADYIFDDWRFLASLQIKPSKKWTTESLLSSYFKHNLNKKGKNKPGKGYHYSDTNYLLLGLIIKKICKTSLSEQYQTRIIKPLNLKHTYFDLNNFDTDSIMHQYRNKRNITKKLNTSFDWAGGGLISTTKDLSIFINALFSDKLFKNPTTLDLMINCKSKEQNGWCYGLGLERVNVAKSKFTEENKNNIVMIGHSGYWGIYMYHFPEENITIVLSIGQVNHKNTSNPWVQLLQDCYSIYSNKKRN